MKIGIDAFFLSMKNNTGIGYYVLDILTGISGIDNINEYVLFTPEVCHSSISSEILKNKKFKIVIVKSIFPQRRLWLQSLNLRKAVLSNNVDIFWGGGEYIPLSLPGNIKTCATIHDVAYKIFPETAALKDKIFHYLFLSLSLRRTDFLITISNNSKNEIIEYLSEKPEKINVIYNGINLNRFKPDENIQKEKIILFVGTLQPRKNLIALIHAFELIADKINHNLVIVGASGWKNSDLSEKILSLPQSVSNRIIFKGYIASNELIKLYQKADLFVAPSLHEGFGLIIAEAIACGTPVLTTRRGAIQEVFEDIPDYADPLSPDDIADKITSILSDPLKMQKKSEDGLKYIKKYNITNIAKQYLEYFNSLS